MKKKIISLLCVFVMALSCTEPIFAEDDALYIQFKNASFTELKALFDSNFSYFDISRNGNTYNASQKSIIILDARQRGFNSFEELNNNVSQSALKLAYKESNPGILGLQGLSDVTLDFDSPEWTDQADVFEIDGKEFIALDKSEDENGEPVLFVIAKDYYGTVALDPDNAGRWDDTYYKLLPYKLTNQMAFGNYSVNLPESILKHLDIMHEWNVEPGSGAGFTSENTLIAPISVISATEYKKYGSKIGPDKEPATGVYWTRTPVLGDSQYHFTVNLAVSETLNKNKGWGGNLLRPVFYLKGSFFKTEKMQKCGANVTAYVDEIVSESDLKDIYSSGEMKEVFGKLSVTPAAITGNAIVGDVLTTDYTYEGSIPLISVDITWMKSRDKISWQTISGASGKSYKITGEDAGYYIRASFSPVFDSVVLKDGETTYSVKEDAVYTDESIAQAVIDINTAPDTEALRKYLQKHESLFHCDYTEDKFSDDAAKIFMADRVSTAAEVVNLYYSAVALDEFAKSTDATAIEKAENQYLLGSITEYARLNDEQKSWVVFNLFQLDDEKNKVSEFTAKEKELVMLARFNNVERTSVSPLIREYYTVLGEDISGLSGYQLEIAGAYVAGKNYGIDINKLKSALAEGIASAKRISSQKPPVTDDAGGTSGGFIPAVTEKPSGSYSDEENFFSDLGNALWSADAVNSLAKKGVLTGNGDGTFSPDRPVTRNEFVKIIVMTFNIEMTDCDLLFEDIPNDSWSEKYIAAAVNAGIISGIDDTHFGDGMYITREDVAVISERLMKYKGVELESSNLKFRDSDEISDYALQAVAKMKYCGIMNGISDELFAPGDNTTRAMAAMIVYKLSNYFTEKSRIDEGYEDDAVTVNPDDKYDIVYKLGILKDDFLKDSKITRGELAAALAVFGNYNLTGGRSRFDDVLPGNRYYEEITAVCDNNIMAEKKKNMFMPDETATYGEAYDAIIAASGHTNYPGGISEAEQVLGKEPVYARVADELTGDMAKKMFFAALEIPGFDIDGTNSISISEKTIMNINFDTYKSKGVVNAVSGMSVGGRGELSDDKIIITVNSKDYLYTADNYDFSDYLGCEVTYYYRKADDENQILSMVMSKSAEPPLKLSFEYITGAENDLSSITYIKSGKEKKAKISKKADFMYNGKRWYGITAADLSPDNGYITLIDTNSDGEYDCVKIENYEYIMVAQIDAANNSVLDKFTWTTHSFEEGVDAEKVNITKNGRYIKMDYLSPGDVLAVAASRDGKLINAYVSDRKLTGIVRAKTADENEIKIDDNVLKCIKNFDFDGLPVNTCITVGLDRNGYAVGYYTELSDSDISIGYLYKINPNSDSDTVTFHILTDRNEYVSLNMSDNLKINDIRANENDVYAEFSYDGKTITSQLIAYSINKEGKIQKIYTSHTPQGITGSQNVPLLLNTKFESGTENSASVIYNSFGMTMDFEYNLLNSAVMFDISLDNGELVKKRSSVKNVGEKVIPQLSSPENLYIYNSDITKVSRLCVYEHRVQGGNEGYNESFNTQAFVVSKILEQYDDYEGGVLTAFRGYHAGKEVTYTFSEQITDSVDIKKIKPGDVLLVWLSGKEITRFRRLYANEESFAYSDETDLLCNYGDRIYTGDRIVRGGTNWDYPYDWAQHIIERAEGKSGSTTAAASRWISLYGSVDFAYKSELYSYPVIKLKVAGKDEAAAYTMDSGTQVYVYNKKTDTIKSVGSENMNFASKNAVLTARYGNVRDVIIYED